MTQVRDEEPPAAARVLVNPLVRAVLRSPLARVLPTGPLVLLRFTGRRSGRRYEVPVGTHRLDGDELVVSGATWARNFADGRDVELVRGGRTERRRGVLVEDRDEVGRVVVALLRHGADLRRLGLRADDPDAVTADDVARTRRVVVRLEEGETVG